MLFPSLAAPTARLAVRVGDRTLTQQELASACAHHVAMLAERGIAAGTHVAVWTQPALETIVALVAHAAAGYVSVPVDPKLGASELAHVLGDAQPVIAVAADAAAVADRGVATLQTQVVTSERPLHCTEVHGAPLLVLYTSGTTGAPKGAVLSDRNIAANLDMLAAAWAWTADDTVVHALPLFHVHGLVLGVFGSVRRGGAIRWVPRFTASALARALTEQAGSTVLFAVPTMYHRLVEEAASDSAIAPALRGARILVSGSAPLSAREHAAIERLCGQRALERYGMTETLISCSTRIAGDRRAGSVGPALDGVELRLVDDARQPVADDADGGEISVRGPHVFAGYLNRPDATAAVLDADGWFYTGDVATRSADGFITIVGRRSTDIIKCGGFKVGAGEVVGALREHPAVVEAAVVGAPDPDLGERIVAFVVVRDPVPADELADLVARSLSPHKRPREIRFLDALPRNAMGKVVVGALKRSLSE